MLVPSFDGANADVPTGKKLRGAWVSLVRGSGAICPVRSAALDKSLLTEHRNCPLAVVAGVARVMKSPFNVRRSGGTWSNWLQEPAARIHRRNSWFAPFVCLGALVVVCSAVSPVDDDVQQAFFTGKPHCSRLAPGKVCSTRVPRNHRPQPGVLLASHPPPKREPAATLSVAESPVYVELFASTTGERSPPIC